MSDEDLHRLLATLRQQTVATLGTLHRGEPSSLSMVPYVLDAATPSFFIHVSALAPHTHDMLAHPRVRTLVIAPQADGPPQARARVTIAEDTALLAAEWTDYVAAESRHLARFSQPASQCAARKRSLSPRRSSIAAIRA